MKLFGVALLSLIPVILSFRVGEELRIKEKRKRAFLKLLCHIHFQIENFLKDQREIFGGFDDPILTKTDFYQELQRQLEEKPCGALGYAWQLYGEDFSFDAQSRQILDELAKHFGFLEKKAQLAQLSRGIDFLEKQEASRKTEWENKIKILRISGVTAGLGILILFI